MPNHLAGPKPSKPCGDHGYLHHGSAPGPFSTERVKVRLRGYPHTGMWEAYFEGRWRVVHVQLKRTYITFQGERITIQIEGV